MKKSNLTFFEKAKKEIRKELKTGLENKVISTHEYKQDSKLDR